MTKKEQERFYAERFLENRPDLGVTELRCFDSPDLLCRVNGEKIGLEVTKFFFESEGPPPQAISRYKTEMGASLQRAHALAGVAPVHVTVQFFDNRVFKDAKARKRLIPEIVSFVGARIPPMEVPVSYSTTDFDSLLREYGVDWVGMLRLPSLTKPTYAIPEVAFLPESTSTRVQERIDEKNALLSRYLEHAQVQWLLILSGPGGLYSIVDFDRDVLSATYTTGFDRVFLFRTFGPNVFELKIEKTKE